MIVPPPQDSAIECLCDRPWSERDKHGSVDPCLLSTSRPTDKKVELKDREQLGSYILECCTSSVRRHVLGVYLAGVLLELWYFDRDGGIGSCSVDITSNPYCLLRFALFVCSGNSLNLGFEPLLSEMESPSGSPDINKTDCSLPITLEGLVRNLQPRPPLIQELRLPVEGDPDRKEIAYRLGNKVIHGTSRGLVGEGTVDICDSQQHKINHCYRFQDMVLYCWETSSRFDVTYSNRPRVKTKL